MRALLSERHDGRTEAHEPPVTQISCNGLVRELIAMMTARSRAGAHSSPNESSPPAKLGACVRRVAQEWAEAVPMFLYAVLSAENKVSA